MKMFGIRSSQILSKRPRTILEWCSCSLLLLGSLALGYSGAVWASAHVYQAYQNWRLEHSKSFSPVHPGSVIGRIKIPRLGLSAVVMEGDDDAALRLAVGHIPRTALPGQTGNVAIAGHRDTFFRGLRHIRKNDVITFEMPGASYRYRVEAIQVVGPKDTRVLNPSEQSTLTLVTCYPFSFVGSAPNRFIVRARQISSPPRSTS